MELYIKLFLMFAKLCAFAFGGGYVMIPSLIKASEKNGWATGAELTDVIAIAGMSPGPIAVNAAVGYGYKVAGFPGVVASFLGIAVPCAVIVIMAASFFFKLYAHPKVRAILYGLNPVITAVIFYAAVSIAMKNGMIAPSSGNLIPKGLNIAIGGFQLFELKSMAIAAATFLMLARTKVQPIFLILAAGVLGVIIF